MNGMRRNIGAAVMVISAMSAAPAIAQEHASFVERRSHPQVLQADSDKALAHDIARQVRRYTRYTIFDDVQIGVDNGVATLSGRVTMSYKAKELGNIVSRVRGVREVQNDIQTLPVSITDDRLRRSLANQIYRDSVFSTYAFHVNPPIHIVVERGNVTLTGAVATELERVKAEMIARGTFGVFNVENKLIVAS